MGDGINHYCQSGNQGKQGKACIIYGAVIVKGRPLRLEEMPEHDRADKEP